LDRTVAVVGDHAEKKRKFLAEEIGGPAHLQIQEVNPLGVGLLGRPERKGLLSARRFGGLPLRQPEKSAEKGGHNRRAYEEGSSEPSLCLWFLAFTKIVSATM
jgi:hypothetical protein